MIYISGPAIDKMDDIPDLGDDADVPIIVPPPDQVLKRTARTKIRKPGMKGEGAHRFTATRSRQKSLATMDTRTSSDMSSSDHGDGEPIVRRPRAETLAEIPPISRPESYSEESFIYDSYARDESDESGPAAGSRSEHSLDFSAVSPPPGPPEPEPPESTLDTTPAPTVPPPLHHPQPQRAAAPSIPP